MKTDQYIKSPNHFPRLGFQNSKSLKIWNYIYIYMGASHMLHSLTTIGFMPITIAVGPSRKSCKEM